MLAALRLVTHLPEDSYEEYVKKVAPNPIATEVKLADLEDNSDIRRLKNLDDKAVARFRKYMRAYRFLTGQDSEMQSG